MKLAIVSGATGNLGKAVVSYFLEQSYQVIGLVHTKEAKDGAREHYNEIEVDLMHEGETKACVEYILKKYDKIDVAVLTAGGFVSGAIDKAGTEDLINQYELNFITAYNLARPIFIKMKSQKSGKIFFIGSQPGMDTRKGINNVAYSLSKSQLFQLANIFNSDAKEMDVKTYVVVPSTIDTPQNRNAMPDADYSSWEKPEAIAKVIGHYTKSPFTDKDKTTLVIQEEM